MKRIKLGTFGIGLALATLLLATQAQASVTFNYLTTIWSQTFGTVGYPGDIVTLNPVSGSVTLTLGGGPVTAQINELDFLAQLSDPSATSYNVSISQMMQLSQGSVSDNLLQLGILDINTSDTLNLSQGSTTSFYFPDIGTVLVTPLALGPVGPNPGGDLYANHYAQFQLVPEPTTMIAGALLLLPFGASTLRMFRKTRTA